MRDRRRTSEGNEEEERRRRSLFPLLTNIAGVVVTVAITIATGSIVRWKKEAKRMGFLLLLPLLIIAIEKKKNFVVAAAVSL